MIALLLLALLQDRPVEATIEAFLKGEKAARAELVRQGPWAILPLQKARAKSPDKIDALVHELKKAAAYPEPKDFEGEYKNEGVLSAGEERELTFSSLNMFAEMGRCAFFVDTFDPARLKATKVTLEEIRSVMQAVREICKQTGLDYGYFHNHIVLALPERLWPSGPPPKVAALAGDDLKKAKALVERLNDKAEAKRDEAQRDLFKLGPGVIAFLESQLKRKESEIVDRCKAILARLRPRVGTFGAPAFVRQDLGEPDGKVLRRLDRKLAGHGWHVNVPLEKVASNFLKEYSLTIELGEHKDRTISIGLAGRVEDFLSLTTQCLGLDFAIQGGNVVIDTPAAIEKRISEGSK